MSVGQAQLLRWHQTPPPSKSRRMLSTLCCCIFVTGHELQLPPAQTGMAITWHLEGAAQCGALPGPCVWEHLLSVLLCSHLLQDETLWLRQGLSSCHSCSCFLASCPWSAEGREAARLMLSHPSSLVTLSPAGTEALVWPLAKAQAVKSCFGWLCQLLSLNLITLSVFSLRKCNFNSCSLG